LRTQCFWGFLSPLFRVILLSCRRYFHFFCTSLNSFVSTSPSK
jgi:hypothetical protein